MDKNIRGRARQVYNLPIFFFLLLKVKFTQLNDRVLFFLLGIMIYTTYYMAYYLSLQNGMIWYNINIEWCLKQRCQPAISRILVLLFHKIRLAKFFTLFFLLYTKTLWLDCATDDMHTYAFYVKAVHLITKHNDVMVYWVVFQFHWMAIIKMII